MSKQHQRQIEDLLYFSRRGEAITRAELSDAMEIPEKTAWRRLALWCRMGLAVEVNPGENPRRYRPTIEVVDRG